MTRDREPWLAEGGHRSHTEVGYARRLDRPGRRSVCGRLRLSPRRSALLALGSPQPSSRPSDSAGRQCPMAKDPAPPNVLQRAEHHVQGRTLAGLVELIPLLVTVVVLVFLVGKADALVRPLAFVAGEPWDFPGIGLIVGLVLFYIVGLVLATRLGRVFAPLEGRGVEPHALGQDCIRRHPASDEVHDVAVQLQPRRFLGVAAGGDGRDGVRDGGA